MELDRSQMRCLFINNPNSGKGKIAKKLDYIQKELEKVFLSVDIKTAHSLQETLDLASHSCGTYDVLTFAGGDGTFDNIVNALADKSNRPILGYIPAGTVNDISRNYKISKNIKKALKVIKQGYVHPFDIGRITYENQPSKTAYFAYVVAMGSFAHVSYDTNQKVKRRFGKIAYYLRVVKEVLRKQHFHVNIESEEKNIESEIPLLLVLNSKSVGGFSVNKKSNLADGKFDVLVMKPGFASGLFNVLRKRKHTRIVTNKITINLDCDTPWCVDGEKGESGNIIIENVPQHLQIFSKIEYKAKKHN